MRPKLAYVVSHPIQYHAPLFRMLARREDIQFRVFYCTRQGVDEYFDPGFQRALKWDVPLLDGYDHTFVPNLFDDSQARGFGRVINPSMGREIARWGADVVIIHGYALATMHLVMLHARRRGTPVLVRGESNLLAKRSLGVRLAKSVAAIGLRKLLAGALAIGTLNAQYWGHYGIPPDRIWLAPYSVDNDFFGGSRADALARAAAWREDLGLSPETRVIGYAAKLSAVKDCATLIRAFADARLEQSALVIAGDGPLRAELEALAASRPHARIHFLGFLNQSEMPSLYALSDVFALPSLYEPWGLVVNEAMNLGCPIIVSDAVGCAPDLVHPDNGWVFPARDVAALSTVLREALGTPDARVRLAAMGEASRRRIAGWGLRETAQGFVDATCAVTKRS
jgi:glycosyltransferase involved in cell wall biosynthesis